jgi:hypothetical protein
MPVTINGTTGVVTPGATIGSINGILKSSSGVVSQAVAGQDYGQLTLATAQTASGTSVDFTGIPSWVKRITVMFNGVSLNGSAQFLLRLGTSSGFASTGYNCVASSSGTSSQTFLSFTNGFGFYGNNPVSIPIGVMVINKVNGNNWIENSSSFTFDGTNYYNLFSHGSVSLASDLNSIRITTSNGTDTFDAGTINISYE